MTGTGCQDLPAAGVVGSPPEVTAVRFAPGRLNAVTVVHLVLGGVCVVGTAVHRAVTRRKGPGRARRERAQEYLRRAGRHSGRCAG